MEFSFVGIQGRRERVIGSNRTVGGSSRETATAFPHTTQICDISSDRPPKLRNLSNDRFKSGTCNHLKLLFQAVSLTEKSTRSERCGLCDEQIVSLRRPPMFPNHGSG
jgi:hypothetical protein